MVVSFLLSILNDPVMKTKQVAYCWEILVRNVQTESQYQHCLTYWFYQINNVVNEVKTNLMETNWTNTFKQLIFALVSV